MTMREEIVAKVRNLPENVLSEIYSVIEKIEEKEKKPNLMERLRKIKIEAPHDFSRNLDLYMSGEKKIDENLD